MVDINRELDNSAEASSDATLLVQGGPRNGEVISLTSEITTLGRQQDNDIVVDDPAVSRSHSAIVAGQSGYRMRDLGSTNGTFVNVRKLPAETATSVFPDDTLRFGRATGYYLMDAKGFFQYLQTLQRFGL